MKNQLKYSIEGFSYLETIIGLSVFTLIGGTLLIFSFSLMKNFTVFQLKTKEEINFIEDYQLISIKMKEIQPPAYILSSSVIENEPNAAKINYFRGDKKSQIIIMNHEKTCIIRVPHESDRIIKSLWYEKPLEEKQRVVGLIFSTMVGKIRKEVNLYFERPGL